VAAAELPYGIAKFSDIPDNGTPQPPPYTLPTSPSDGSASITKIIHPQQESFYSALRWVLTRRDQIVNQMTEACLNQCLDSLISNMIILKEDYELVRSERTRSAKVRRLIDTCDMQGELFARIIVQKLKENRQNDLQPFPEFWQDG
ncbi:unnamed protein product, partial [Staurois parvus]